MATTGTARGKVALTLEVDGLPATLRAFSRFGKAANTELREAAQRHATSAVPAILAAAAGQGPQARLAATSLRAPRDRTPVLVAGGSRRLPVQGRRRRPPAGMVLFGAEFGGGARPSTRQFPPHRGTEGYWLFPTLRRILPGLTRRYIDTLEALARKWGAGG
jgi:hypothetical protein